MSLSNTRWGDALADLAFSKMTGDLAPSTEDQDTFRAFIKEWAAEHQTEITDNAETKSDGATLGHAPGAAATITALPGTVS